MAVPLTSMLRATNYLTANDLIFADKMDEVGGGKVVEKHSSIKFGTEFVTPRAKLAFAELR